MLSQKEMEKLDPMISVSRALLTLKGCVSTDVRVLHALDLLREAMLIQDAHDKKRARRQAKKKSKSRKGTQS